MTPKQVKQEQNGIKLRWTKIIVEFTQEGREIYTKDLWNACLSRNATEGFDCGQFMARANKLLRALEKKGVLISRMVDHPGSGRHWRRRYYRDNRPLCDYPGCKKKSKFEVREQIGRNWGLPRYHCEDHEGR